MAPLTRAAPRAAAAATLAALGLLLAACNGGDGPNVPTAEDAQLPPERELDLPTTTLDLGGLDLDVPDGFSPIPVAAGGFGLAVPETWQATLLTPQAISVLLEAGVPDDGFVDDALEAAEQGTLLYAAGPTADGIDATTTAGVAGQAAEDPGATTLQIVAAVEQEVAQGLEVDANFQTSAGSAVRLRFVDDDRQVTRFVYPDVDGVWSLTISTDGTSPDLVAAHDAVADDVGGTFALTSS